MAKKKQTKAEREERQAFAKANAGNAQRTRELAEKGLAKLEAERSKQ